MKILVSFIERRLIAMTVVVISLLGCCGFGFSKKIEDTRGKGIERFVLSDNDSIVYDLIEILEIGKGLEKRKKEKIEKKIRSFPGKIVRRDTGSFFLQTVLAIGYNEFITEDFNRARKAAQDFTEQVLSDDWKSNFAKFWLIRYTDMSLNTKERQRDDSLKREENDNR